MTVSTVRRPTPSASLNDNPFGAVLRLHDISKAIQKDYREQALASQQKTFDHTMSGIEKSRQSQRKNFILQITSHVVTMVTSGAALYMSFKPEIKSLLSKSPKNDAANKALKTTAATEGTTVDVISGTIDPIKNVDFHKVQARVSAVTTTGNGIAGTLSAGGNWESKTGDLEQESERAMATRESQVLDLRNSMMNEHGANAREIRDSIRNMIPNRSFHA